VHEREHDLSTAGQMPRVDFYLQKNGPPGARLRLCCRLAERILAERVRILIHCPDRGLAGRIDELLWTFRDDSFVPHGLIGATDPELTPVLISPDGTPEERNQVLINLDLDPPPFASRFERICEPVDPDPAVLQAARRRYAHYRTQGWELSHHDIVR
jgi:DNA polymerase-3 subunit chi